MSKQEKLERLTAALNNKKGDRVPISDGFWTGFMKNAKKEWGKDVDVYRKFDLDYIIINPNLDPIIKDFEILKQQGDDITVKTGFGATVLRRGDLPMPHFEEFAVKEPEEMATFVLESPRDPRRLYREGQDQLNCLSDQLVEGLPCWMDRVNAYEKDFPVFGGICEGYEFVWRCVGTENALFWMALEPELFGDFMARIGDYLVEVVKFQIEEAKGKLSGFYIWGDIAYVNGMLFSPDMWRQYFKPITQRLIKTIKDAGLLVIYHGCGDARAVYEDFIDIGLMGYHPVEVKAHLDVVELKKQYDGKLAFVGNMDVREMESGDERRILKEVLYKLQAAKNGGYIAQSDHSVSSDVSAKSYAYFVKCVKEYGKFPLDIEKIQAKLKELE